MSETHVELRRCLMVRVAGRLCALPLEAVIEVLRVPQFDVAGQAVAGQDVAGLLGFAPLRGEPAAVFSLGVLLGFQSAATAGLEQRAVRVRVADGSAALVVDEVIGLRAIAPADLARIELPGGRERHLGRFDEDFASMIELGGLVPDELPLPAPAPPASQAEVPG